MSWNEQDVEKYKIIAKKVDFSKNTEDASQEINPEAGPNSLDSVALVPNGASSPAAGLDADYVLSVLINLSLA